MYNRKIIISIKEMYTMKIIYEKPKAEDYVLKASVRTQINVVCYVDVNKYEKTIGSPLFYSRLIFKKNVIKCRRI